MAISDLKLFKIYSLFYLCALYIVSEASFISSYQSNNNYYRYSVQGDRQRSKRYVENVISRLADNYAPDSSAGGYPNYQDKEILGRGWSRSSRMELVGNVAVEAVPSSLHSSADVPLQVPSTPNPSSPSSGVLLGGGNVFSHHSVDNDEHLPSLTHDTDVNNKTPKLPKKSDDTKKPISEPKKFEGPKMTDQAKLEKILGEVDVLPSMQRTTTPRSQTSTLTINHQDGEEFDVNSGEFPQEVTKFTLEKNNITDRQEDHHIYYNSTFISDAKVGQDYWVDLDNEKDVVVDEMLSMSHRRAATVKLSFDFPFYGHSVRNMTIATGGFLYTGDHIHAWLAITQYIAPLMANFDTSLSPDSHVKYRDNGTALTVEWEKVTLQDKKDAGEFSFQVTLHKSGDIVFVYRTIPLLVDEIEDTQHPVKVGLSDAYIIDKTIFYFRRKTIYEYHRVNFKRDSIKNWTVIYLSALPTCIDLIDCTSCLTTKINFECSWCESVGRCSSGFDRRRQEWTTKQCELTSITDDEECSAQSSNIKAQNLPSHRHLPHVASIQPGEGSSESNSGVQMSGMLGLFLAVALIGGLGMWVLYAYRNPHTPSGQLLIKYRPSQWSLRRGEARYTAASIHM